MGKKNAKLNDIDCIKELAMTEEMIKQLETLAQKELILAEIIGWLKGKGLWEDCNRDLNIIKSNTELFDKKLREFKRQNQAIL